MPIPRKGAGTLEYVATRSRIAAIAVIARSHPIPHPAPAQVAVQTLPKSRAAEYRAVYRDKRQEDAERGIERRGIFFNRHLHQLGHRCDYGYKHDK